ncbi:MAG: DUF1801 domain-containing protein [Pirellulaceae bacterium]|nr:DUF1801 domain-containing protein [Pirellulaceae bacterium]
MAKKRSTQTFDGYLHGLPEEFRLALERVRQIIHATAPGAEECVSYGVAAFRHQDRMLVALGATKSHCGFYLMSKQIVGQFAEELKRFETSTGTIRFTPDQPLPVALVRKLVRARIAENKAIAD